MGREPVEPAALHFVLTLGNLTLAVAALAAFGAWQSRCQPALALSPLAPPQPSKAVRAGAGPTVYFVASQDQADSLEELFATNAAGGAGPKAPYKVMVVSSAAREHQVRQAIAARNVRRIAAGQPAVQITDLRSSSPSTVQPSPASDLFDDR